MYGINSKGQFPKVYRDFLREQGAPSALRRDNAKEEKSEEVLDLQRKLLIKDQFSEPHNQQQNTVEMGAIRWLTTNTHRLLDTTGAPDGAWYLAMKHLASLHNVCYDPTIKTVPKQKRHGVTPDISAYLQHAFWDPVLYYDNEHSWPHTKERSGRWVGVAENVGDILTYWIVDDQSKQLLARSVVRPFSGNRRVKWDPDLDTSTARNTAHNGGDIRPPKAKIKQLLDTISDQHDDLEPDPKPHPPIVTEFGNKEDKFPPTPILKQHTYDMKDASMDVTQPYVPYLDEDPYDGPSKLRYSSVQQPMDTNIRSYPSTKRKAYNKLKAKTNYKPKETDLYDPTIKTEIPTLGPDVTAEVCDDRGATESQQGLRRSNRRKVLSTAKWAPIQSKSFLRLATGLVLGALTLPNQVSANPVKPLPDFPTVALDYNPITCEPTSRSKQLNKLRAYHAVLDKWNSMMDPDPLEQRWSINKVVQDRVVHEGTDDRRVFLKVQFNDGPKKWMTMDEVQLVDPFVAINHAISHDCKHKSEYSWVDTYLDFDNNTVEMVKALKTSAKDGTKYKFGVEVPRSAKHALEMDKRNGNKGWQESIKVELDQIKDYKVFRVLPDDQPMPPGFKRIPYHLVFDVKFDGRLKSRLVAGGHRSPDVPREDIFSPVVSMEAVRLGFLMAKMNDLKVCAGDVGNAFLYGKTREKLYVVAGPEFGPELAGKRLIIDRSLYDLKSSAARYHEHFSATLRKMGYLPSKADPDLWMKWNPEENCYEYIARYVDDVISFSKDPMKVMKTLADT